MNWLAHLFLSEPCPAFRIGNVLPDLVRLPQLATLPEKYQRGIRQHLLIDTYTDSHPVVHQSILRLGPDFRRYGGILMDMFYDHFLCRQWSSFSDQPLADFTAEFYADFKSHRHELPMDALPPLDGMSKWDWLGSYGDLEALENTLTRIGRRFKKPVYLAGAMPLLIREYDRLQQDFAEFFPDLRNRVSTDTLP